MIQNGHICSQSSSTSTLASRCYARSGYARTLHTNPFFSTLLFVELSLGENWRCPSSDKGEPSQPRAKVGGLLFFTNSPREVYLALSLPSLFGGAVNFPPPDCLVARQTTNKVILKENHVDHRGDVGLTSRA